MRRVAPGLRHLLQSFCCSGTTGYRDEPNVDEDGKPKLRRTTAVHHAARHSCSHVVSKLFKIYDRFDANYIDKSGLTHFHVACMYGCEDVVKKFLELGQDPNCLVSETGNSPLHLAVKNQHKIVVELLLRSAADPNLANKDGSTPLHVICSEDVGDELAELFFDINDEKNQVMQVDAQDKEGNTPLHLAMTYSQEKLVELLLRHGANPNSTNENRETPLHKICLRDNFDEDNLAELFFKIVSDIQKTVQVNALDKLNRTPLQLALTWAQKLTLESLLRNNPDPNFTNAKGFTILHIICQRYHDDDLMEKFFKITDDKHQLVQVDARDELGRTPLQLAVANLLPKTIDILLDRGADLTGFVFPTENYFGERLDPENDHWIDSAKKLASGALAVVECLEKRGYELDRSDVLTIMKFFAKQELFEESSDFTKRWYNNEVFARKAKKIKIRDNDPDQSLYDLIWLQPEEAEKLRLFAIRTMSFHHLDIFHAKDFCRSNCNDDKSPKSHFSFSLQTHDSVGLRIHTRTAAAGAHDTLLGQRELDSLVGHKQCMPDGTWFLHPESKQPWSNYTTCVNLVDLEWQQHLNRLYETGYSISLVALLLSLGILTYFRSLRCARITLHMNLFASFAMNNALWLIWYGSVVNTELLFNNSIMCRILHVILHYFLLTNYAWMLCEGFYLHTILVSAFTSDRRLVKWLMALGWSVPAVIIVIYTSLRSNSLDPADSKQ
ncbi:unnamed protein product [Trichogramma brassicae]|uniref:G-protein coupled receptors family 2 profile 2 domain-containing protein n=1 Tax=Trichogramma brassicae TaxID=86971 RepID=A0A6H5HU65_9HYME|nr:unnamed protein product [Trichogramma brassicae]